MLWCPRASQHAHRNTIPVTQSYSQTEKWIPLQSEMHYR